MSVFIDYGFTASGIDISKDALALSDSTLGCKYAPSQYSLYEMSMTSLLFDPETFDCVSDVFSSYCLENSSFLLYLSDIFTILRPGGTFFLFTPSKRSDAYLYPSPSTLISDGLLDGISRLDSPYTSNNYYFRFEHERDLEAKVAQLGFECLSLERTSRTYRNGQEYFEYHILTARKP